MLTRDSTEPADPRGGPITGGQVVPSHWRNTPQNGPIQLAGDTDLLAALAVGTYRHQRREGRTLTQIHHGLDTAISDQYTDSSFVTASSPGSI